MKHLLLVIVAFTAFASLARAQAEVERFNRQLEETRRRTMALPENVPLEQKALFDYGAFASFNYFSIDDPRGRSHGLRQFDLFPYARLNFDGANEVYLRGRWGYLDWNSGQDLTGRGDEPIDGDLDRGFYRFDYRNYQSVYHDRDIGFNLSAKAGRDLAYWANGLVLSQVIDGIFLGTQTDFVDAELIAGVTPTRTVDIDSSRPAFDYNTRRGFYGAQLGKQLGRHRPFLYGLVQQDYNEDDTSIIPAPSGANIVTNYEYNSYYIGTGVTGSITDRLLYGVEFVYQGGDTLSNSFQQTDVPVGPGVVARQIVPIQQTTDDINAWAFDARLDYLLNDSRQTRFTGEVILASGDPDRLSSSTNTFGGNAPNTSDRSFNAFGLLNTGLAFAPQVSNVLIFRVGAVTFPLPEYSLLKRFQAGVDVFIYNKLASSAPIDEETTDDGYLGWEPDLFLNWQITSDVTLSFRYGIFFPGSAIVDPNDEWRQFISAGVTYAF
jgi:hypothetical protein